MKKNVRGKRMKRPNILVILTDQQRYDCTGYSGVSPVATPNLDELASEGVTFDNAFSVIPTCCPARQAFLSGKRPERFGSLWNYGKIKFPTQVLPKEEFSFARALKDVGYQTGYLGKWHVSPKHEPEDFGFDDVVHERDMWQHWNENHFKGHWQLSRENGEFGMLGGKSEMPFESNSPHFFGRRAIEMMKRMREKENPFLVFLSIEEPHLPCYPTEPFAGMYTEEDAVKWGSFDDTFEDKPYIQKQMLKFWGFEKLGWKEWSKSVAAYYGSIAETDHAIGEVLSYVKESGLEEDTVIIFTTDHGDMCGGHRMYNKCYVMYDDIVRTPMIVKWKNHFEPHASHDFVHNLLDLHATILELAGAQGDPITDGKSLSSQLGGKDEGRKFAFSTYNGTEDGFFLQRMVRCAEYKYIWNLTDVDELYDLKKDPHELKNEVHNPEYADVLKMLRLQLVEELKACDDPLSGGAAERIQLINGDKL